MADAEFDFVDAYDKAPQTNWFHHCQQTAKPYVVIRRHHGTADVMWDYVTFPPRYDQILLEHEKQIEQDAISIFEEYAEDASAFRVTPTLISFTNMPIDCVEHAASDLYRLIESYVEDTPRPFVPTALDEPSLHEMAAAA